MKGVSIFYNAKAFCDLNNYDVIDVEITSTFYYEQDC